MEKGGGKGVSGDALFLEIALHRRLIRGPPTTPLPNPTNSIYKRNLLPELLPSVNKFVKAAPHKRKIEERYGLIALMFARQECFGLFPQPS